MEGCRGSVSQARVMVTKGSVCYSLPFGILVRSQSGCYWSLTYEPRCVGLSHLNPVALASQVDNLFFFGDLNYRLDLSRDDIEVGTDSRGTTTCSHTCPLTPNPSSLVPARSLTLAPMVQRSKSFTLTRSLTPLRCPCVGPRLDASARLTPSKDSSTTTSCTSRRRRAGSLRAWMRGTSGFCRLSR